MLTRTTDNNRDYLLYIISKLSAYRNDDVMESIDTYIYDRTMESKYILNTDIDSDPFIKFSAITLTKFIFDLGAYSGYLDQDLSTFITLLTKEFKYDEVIFYNKVYEVIKTLSDSTNKLVFAMYSIYEFVNEISTALSRGETENYINGIISNIISTSGPYLEVTLTDMLTTFIKSLIKDRIYREELLDLFGLSNYDFMEIIVEIIDDFFAREKNELWLYKSVSELADFTTSYLLVNRNLISFDECLVLGPQYKIVNGVEEVYKFNLLFLKG